LAQTLNFTRAAEECNVTQPTLTRAIQLLEAELGGDLVCRERQQTHLTEFGRQLLPLLQQCYAAAASAQTLARAVVKNDIAPLSIVVSRSVNIALFARQMGALAGAFPGLRLTIRRAAGRHILDVLKQGEAELAIAGPLGEVWDRVDSWPLFVETYDFVVDHRRPLASDEGAATERAKAAGVMICTECDIADDIAAYLAENGLVRSGTFEAETDDDLLTLLQSHDGIGLVPASAKASAPIIRVPAPTLRRPIVLYGVAGRRRSPVANTLLNLLRAADWSVCECS
jgi:DNA-binding transcriptional LysR family regulator